MIYKDEEILARVHVTKTGSDLYELKDDGSLGKSLDIFIDHDPEYHVVWYEIAELEHITTPFSDPKHGFYETIEDAEKAIDWFYRKNKDNE